MRGTDKAYDNRYKAEKVETTKERKSTSLVERRPKNADSGKHACLEQRANKQKLKTSVLSTFEYNTFVDIWRSSLTADTRQSWKNKVQSRGPIKNDKDQRQQLETKGEEVDHRNITDFYRHQTA